MNNKENNKYHQVDKQLSGKNNARLHSTTRTDDSYTQPIFNKEYEYPHSKVTKPKIEGVVNQKEWVDNGSRT